MLNKFTCLIILVFLSAFFISFKTLFYSSQPPSDHSGAPGGSLCNDCHSSFPLNSAGGGIVINGLPSSFNPGQTYPFSVTISHGTADRLRWGFEINARNGNNIGIGTFDPGTNTNVALNSGPSEISHNGAVVTSPSSSYTYTGMLWTAPSTITAVDNQVTFYTVGNASNNNSGTDGDYIYTSTILTILPVDLKELRYKIIDDYKVQLIWKTSNESNSKEFVIEKSDDNRTFYELSKISAAGNSLTVKEYSYNDNRPSYFNRPVFYRLKLVDIDGKFKYSKIIQLSLKGRSAYVAQLSPNPAKDKICLEIFSDKNRNAEILVIDAMGKGVYAEQLSLQKGNNAHTVIINAYSHGRYFLRLKTDDYIQNIGFIKL